MFLHQSISMYLYISVFVFIFVSLGWFVRWETSCSIAAVSGLLLLVFVSLYEILLPRYGKWSTNFRSLTHSWWSKDELISDVLIETSTHGRASVSQPVKTYIHQLWADTGCREEDLPGSMDDCDGWQEREPGTSSGLDDDDIYVCESVNQVSLSINHTLFISINLSSYLSQPVHNQQFLYLRLVISI